MICITTGLRKARLLVRMSFYGTINGQLMEKTTLMWSIDSDLLIFQVQLSRETLNCKPLFTMM